MNKCFVHRDKSCQYQTFCPQWKPHALLQPQVNTESKTISSQNWSPEVVSNQSQEVKPESRGQTRLKRSHQSQKVKPEVKPESEVKADSRARGMILTSGGGGWIYQVVPERKRPAASVISLATCNHGNSLGGQGQGHHVIIPVEGRG